MEEDGNKRLRNTTTGNGRSIDRISTLSQDIIHAHIFPRLRNKDMKIMSCLSKTWYLHSNSFPYLDFNLSSLATQLNNYLGTRTPNQEDIHKFNNYVHQTLDRFYNHSNNQIIRRLTIPFHFQLETARLLHNWIHLALQHGVEEFNLFIKNPPKLYRDMHQSMTWYDLPPLFFSHPNSIIKVVILQGCSLLHSFLTPSTHTNLLLKSLYLRHVLMDDTSLSSIISCCPLIEDLEIIQCMHIVKYLRISHLHRLKRLVINDLEGDIEINSSSLERLSLYGIFKVTIIGDCPLLTDLNLGNTCELDLQDLLSRLPLLRTLFLGIVYCLNKLRVSSHTLRKLEVKHCPNLVQLNIDDAPSLLSVVISSGEAPLPSFTRSWLHQIKDVMYVTKDGTETKLVIDATSEISNIYSYIKSTNSTFLISAPYPEIKFIFNW